jgi:hypothetical protein
MGAGVRITNKLDQFEDATRRRAETAMTMMLITGAAHASAFTPIDTSNMLNSQYRALNTQQGRVNGRVGYTAEYAKHVHNPEVKQTFRRSGARKEFLTEGFEEAKPVLRSILKKEMKR